jgi:hypothetical protein
MTIVYSIPLAGLFLLILIPCLILSLGGVWVARHQRWMVAGKDNDAISLIHALAGILYAVALGLVVINLQPGYSEVQMVVMREANLMEDLFVNANGLNGGVREEIQSHTLAYGDAVTNEWQSIGRKNDSELSSHKPI